MALAMGCSTPEGIGAGITAGPSTASSARCRQSAQRPKASERELHDRDVPVRMHSTACSTPEGIGAGITDPHHAYVGEQIACSTPEGIGAGITAVVRRLASGEQVLNARRHRSGNYSRAPATRSRQATRAQRPKASERELRRNARTSIRSSSVCSTPEGIGAGITRHDARGLLRRRPVLNARRHRSGNYFRMSRFADVGIRVCSTPEGIGAGITPGR